MSSLLEIIRLKVNDRFTSEPDLFVQLRASADKGGVKSEQLYGLGIEHPDELIWILFFERAEDRKVFAWPQGYGNFTEKIAEISVIKFSPQTMPIDIRTWKTIESSPITEFLYLPIKPKMTLETAKLVIDDVVVALAAASGGHGGGHGVLVEDSHKCLILVGWDSVEAHGKFGSTKAFKTVVFPGLMSITPDIELAEYWHVPLEKHRV